MRLIFPRSKKVNFLSGISMSIFSCDRFKVWDRTRKRAEDERNLSVSESLVPLVISCRALYLSRWSHRSPSAMLNCNATSNQDLMIKEAL